MLNLLINSVRIPVPQIAQNFAVNLIGEISSRQGGYSNNFTIPLSREIADALDYPTDVNNNNRKPYQKVSADLYDGNTFITSGYLRYNQVNQREIEASFFTDNSEWFSLVKDLDLADLDYSDLDHTYNLTNVVNNRNATEGFLYPIIDYGEFASRAPFATGVNVEELFPAIYVKTIIKKLGQQIGWKFTGELIDHPTFDKMILPFAKEEFSHSDSYIADNTILAEKNADQSIPAANALIQWTNPTDTAVDVGVNSEFTVRIKVTVTGSITSDTLEYYVNGVYDSDLDTITTAGTFFYDKTTTLAALGNIGVNYVNGGGSSGTITTDSFIQLTPSNRIFQGNDIDLSRTLPDLSCEDLLKYLFFSFGVVPIANPLAKTVQLFLHKNIKSRITSARDWSDKLDMGSDQLVDFTELLDGYGSTSRMSYTVDDNDQTAESYTSETGEQFGQGQLAIDNEHIQRTRVIYEAPFAPMFNQISFGGLLYVPRIPWLDSTGAKDVTPVPRVALAIVSQSVSDLSDGATSSFRYTGTGGPTDVSSLPFVWFEKTAYYATVDAYKEGLAYGEPRPSGVWIGSPLASNFLQDYQAVLNSMKYLTADFNLDAVDINDLPFTELIYLDQFKSYFYLNAVNNYDGQRLTECELLRLPS